MKYRLGLDLGVGSIGSAVIQLNEHNEAMDIIDAGVRIFEVSEGAEERRLKRTARKNLIRTKKRLNLLAQKLFENGLWVDSSPEGTDRLRSKSPYIIRHDALFGQLASPHYIGRAILHIAKHRGAGFVSAAEELEEEILEEGTTPKKKGKVSSYDMMLQHLKETNSLTVGDYFYKRIEEGYAKDENGEKKSPEKRHIRQSKYALEKNIVDYAIPRYLVKDEFHKIWDTQAQYFPQMNKDGLKQEIYDILFYEKSPAPYAVGKCIYFRNEDRLLKAHPLSEMRRIYEEVNNIRIETDMGRRRLTLEERDKIINELLLKGKNAGKKLIKELLNFSGQIKISLIDDKVIKAYLYSRPEFMNVEYIKNLSGEKLAEFVEFLAEPKDENDINGRLLNEDKLILQLKELLNIEDEKEIGNLLTKLPKGRGMLGKSATEILLAEMKQEVLSPREITDRLAKEDTRFMAEEEIARTMQGKCCSLPYYGEILQTDTQPLPHLVIQNNTNLNPDEIRWGKIANPAVHMILNQIRLVVNDIIRIYGKPYDINLELGRDVGMSTKKKKQEEIKQKQNEKLNEEAKKYLNERKLFVNRNNILKYKLAKEQGWVDAYDPRVEIPQNFSGFEIEHIIPQAKGGTDTYSNLCLVNRKDNLNKGDRFAYEYFEQTKEPEVIRKILENARKRMPQKAWRFEADAREKFEDNGDEDETNRYLTDTRYVSKMAQRYLRAIIDCDDSDEVIHTRILAVKGGQTAELRKHWYLWGIEYDLAGLNDSVPEKISCSPYWVNEKTGEVIDGECMPDYDNCWKRQVTKSNPDWKKKPRIDHRHHAMDAITVACANRSLIQKMAKEMDLRRLEYPLPLTSVHSVGDFRRRVIEVLKNINVSHKPNHSKAGQFHKETGRIVLCTNPEDNEALITSYSRKVLQVVKSFKDLDKLLVPDTIKDEWAEEIAENKAKQAKLKENFELYANTAEQILIAENEQAIQDGKKEIKITEGRILTKAFRIIQDKKLWKGDNFKCYENNSSLVYIPKHKLAYEGRNNHCVDFFEKDGKVGWEVIKRFDINQADFVPQWKKDGGKIIWSIQQGDLLELNTPEEWKGYTDKDRCLARVKKFSAGSIAIDYVTDARGTTKAKEDPEYMLVGSLVNRGLSYFTKNKARKIELTPFGKVKKKHKVLWNGTKAKS
ncbi:MAG: type II CRISPR RNA-guided endonuclease Cas9 [Alphaproteobacteria bacterium]|nr:type II CRISPR RNA-guided endonuclease Cas9 [Alphaproteobacteria bacterium]